MSDDDHNQSPRPRTRGAIPFRPPRPRWRRDPDGHPSRPRVRKLRLFSILAGLGVLAVVSMLFGMMMAVASDLPELENRAQYKREQNSYLYDDQWRPIGIFAPDNHVVIDTSNEISQNMKAAIISTEDRRFWTDPGIDFRGIARALAADLTGSATQGASTIAQQFVKNALAEQGNRTILEKLREAALAFHLTHRWSKTKILTEYLNSIYFGNGAYGVESAARVYFGHVHGLDSTVTTGSAKGCGDSTPGVTRPTCASMLAPWEAALLAGMVANPTAFDPILHPQAAIGRRNLVLQNMYQQHYISRTEYDYSRNQPLPKADQLERPAEPLAAPYFTSWLRPQVLKAMGLGHGVPAPVAEYRAYYGGLRIRSTIDLPMQQAAEHAISSELPSGSGMPTASLVAIDNRTGEVRAMIGGPLVDGQEDFSKFPFNLATQGHRQPGSAFKAFTLAAALERGYGPSSVFDSKPLVLTVPHTRGREHFPVRNFGNVYTGPTNLQSATDESDNSVFMQLGLAVGIHKVARLAKAMGIRSPVSNNYSMILGGLHEGVSPLDLAHAYETIAEGGRRVYNPRLGDVDEGPTGIAQINCPVCKHKVMADHPHYKRVVPATIAAGVHSMLEGVVSRGTGTSAAISGYVVAGKTGTTNNYGDAWFVGWTPQITTAVWVGYPNKLVPMLHLYQGGPVEGGTFPALIWHQFMSSALQIFASEQAAQDHGKSPSTTTTSTYSTPAPAPSTGSTATQTTPAAPTGTATNPAPQPTTPAPQPTTPAAPTGTGGTSGGTGGTGGTGTGGTGGAGLGGGGG